MKIAIDITPLETGHADRGIGIYTKLLIESLQRHESQHTYHFFTRKQNIPKNVDIVHYPYFDPFFITLPLYKPFPTVVTVHDLIPLVFPDKFPAGLRGNVKWQIQKISLKGATRIITDSENSKKDISSVVGFDKQKIDVVYLAQSDFIKPFADKTKLDVIRKKYKLPERYVLYIGNVNWNKNIPVLLQVFKRVKSQESRVKSQNDVIKQDVKLVLVGKAFLDDALRETQQINALMRSLGVEKRVVKLGFVPDSDLSALYAMAACLVQPSVYEGFGLPVLEAMASGCVVVTSGTSSLSEIAGPAIRIDPYAIESMREGIVKALALPQKEREYLIKDQLEWVKRFSWEKVARETVDAYRKALKN